MLITRTVTKKILEILVHETFSNFGVLVSSSLLDSLKFLGFYYATNAGISINIEDLKTPKIKEKILIKANKEIDEISTLWQEGFVSDTERFQTIIDSWNIATESLKNRIVDYYQTFDPANNLYIMAFSGARGNMSQVRQLVGMRGLMSDQEGNIIDLPIQANFREGLSSIDYIISSYGARKGIVDTALKTADSGYLTRRLIYIAQDLIIREIDCNTQIGLLILLNKTTNTKNIIGRNLINARMLNYPYKKVFEKNEVLDTIFLKKLKKEMSPLILNVRSSLTCNVNGSICQNCYGWDLAQEKGISLGEAVGIIAAQSIGEPGTQLTMRTFHTGGIFTSETVKQILAPFSGKIIIPDSLKTISYRTNHGTNVLKLQQEATLVIINWQGAEKTVFLDIGSFLYLKKSCFLKKNQLIAEYSAQSVIPGKRRLKPIYTSVAGEIRFENLLVRKMLRDTRTVKVNQEDSVLWLASGKIFPLPKEIKYKFPKKLELQKSFGILKIITPEQGVIMYEENKIIIFNKKKKIIIDFLLLKKFFKNCSFKFSPLVRNYQYVDKHTILSKIEIFSNFEGAIYVVRNKMSKYISTFFIITESDTWQINTDQVNDFSFYTNKKSLVRSGKELNTTSKFSRSGFFLKKDGFKMIFQSATPIFLSRGTILNYKQGDFVLEKKIFATLVNYTQQTEDIVQGLPKIEELVEARRPKIKSYLSERPGIVLKNNMLENISYKKIEKEDSFPIITCLSEKILDKQIKEKEKLKEKRIVKGKTKKKTKSLIPKFQPLYIMHSFYLKDDIIIYENCIFRALAIPKIFQPIGSFEFMSGSVVFQTLYKELEEFTESENLIRTSLKENLLINNKNYTWYYDLDSFEEKNKILFRLTKEGNVIKWATLRDNEKEKPTFFTNSDLGDYIINTKEFGFIYLQKLIPIKEYELPLISKILFEPGQFIDIGEPMTEGIIDLHDLLQIFFQYHSILDGILEGTIRSLYKFQLLLVNSIQAIYQSQGVNISSKHIEIIVRQMTSKVVVEESGDTPLLPGELIRFSLIKEISEALKVHETYKIPVYQPLLISATNSSLSKDGFLSAAGFQETKRVLTKAALEGSADWLRGLKECIIVGRLIPGGSTFLNYKSYLDNIYLFKNVKE
jgi:hypothetical protein